MTSEELKNKFIAAKNISEEKETLFKKLEILCVFLTDVDLCQELAEEYTQKARQLIESLIDNIVKKMRGKVEELNHILVENNEKSKLDVIKIANKTARNLISLLDNESLNLRTTKGRLENIKLILDSRRIQEIFDAVFTKAYNELAEIKITLENVGRTQRFLLIKDKLSTGDLNSTFAHSSLVSFLEEIEAINTSSAETNADLNLMKRKARKYIEETASSTSPDPESEKKRTKFSESNDTLFICRAYSLNKNNSDTETDTDEKDESVLSSNPYAFVNQEEFSPSLKECKNEEKLSVNSNS